MYGLVHLNHDMSSDFSSWIFVRIFWFLRYLELFFAKLCGKEFLSYIFPDFCFSLHNENHTKQRFAIYQAFFLKIFANSRPAASTFKSFSRSLEQFFFTLGQNNFGNKIPLEIEWKSSIMKYKWYFVTKIVLT